MQNAKLYNMIVTNKVTGAKMKATLTIEDGGDVDEAIGDCQSNFLWETFDFEVSEIGSVQLNDDEPINVYGDVTEVK